MTGSDTPISTEMDPFLDAIASREVAPAGGSGAAAVGAIGAALAEMAAVHTAAAGQQGDQVEGIGERLAADRRLLLELADADARIVESAFGGTPDLDRRTHEQLVAVPLAIAETCLNVLSGARELSELSIDSVGQDLQTGRMLVTGALRAALATASGNLDFLEGPARERLADRVTAAENAAASLSDADRRE
ncbi:cyclodeaminase/cyclohydrolase family protein [Halodesulfurarchaeum sp. HSR-GB]|uniref:cyclodeaminase/cyclohydrolase family protein n=1 Tax=Halodesulfurarchaeum sp. HSR-GB TaxID=3074077 RepID=UPI00286463C0|nr:cyclodeaminase/cyclohydrolase family protein [Halodesulfurarchaeum sp. HSR-GB]MDR5656441.1 cyclodeaminase/cyclohydrolase family protein [Halodesulfurarchaeum sp. HSR-GB]